MIHRAIELGGNVHLDGDDLGDPKKNPTDFLSSRARLSLDPEAQHGPHVTRIGEIP